MPHPNSNEDARQRHLRNLRAWRNPAPRDLSLGGLGDFVKRRYAKPHKQVGRVAELWAELVPPHLVERATLAGLRRGVLTVHVPDSATLYELDRALRGGVELQLKRGSPSTLRRVKLRVGGEGPRE